jgi:hypothetical protein
MPTSIPPEAATLTARLLQAQRHVLGDRLLALYLFGSAATGSFEASISDIDTVAVLATDPTDNDIASLTDMHESLVNDAPAWNDRVEVDYLSATALANFRSHSWPAARISPGEPFHRIQIDQRWVLDWYQVLVSGVALYGPRPQTLIPPITHEEFVTALRQLLRELPDRLTEDVSSGGLAYAVLTACRAVRVCRTGECVSKKEAAEWAAGQLPQLSNLIRGALARRYEVRTGAASRKSPLAETRQFVDAVINLCADS